MRKRSTEKWSHSPESSGQYMMKSGSELFFLTPQLLSLNAVCLVLENKKQPGRESGKGKFFLIKDLDSFKHSQGNPPWLLTPKSSRWLWNGIAMTISDGSAGLGQYWMHDTAVLAVWNAFLKCSRPCFSKWGPRASSINLTWELGDADS